MEIRRVALACLALALATDGAAAERTAPGPGCLDARAVERVRRFDPDTLLIGSPSGHFVLNLVPGCGAGLQDEQTLLAADGWVCGGEREFVRAGDVLCPIAALTPLPAREYARLALRLDQAATAGSGGTTTLAAVEVTAKAGPALRFRGDPEYCFSRRALRGWRLDGNDLVVDTAPRRAGGNRRYRVELAHACPELEWNESIDFRSGIGLGLICGNPGDRVEAVVEADAALTLDRLEAARAGVRSSCQIAAVYPER